MVSPSQVGEGPTATTHITVKPTDTGLTTNMIISTNRRNYTIKLVSRKDDWMPLVAFSYPEDEAAAWAAYHDAQRRYKEQTVIPETGQSVEHLDFDYALSGDRPSWTPLRVYNDGVKTYIQFPPSVKNTTAPSLVSLGTDGGIFKGPSTQLVNYRVAGDRYVVDKVLDRAALIIGVGKDQVRVEINHKRKGG
jgi:type IV secretion system protein VirB9